MAAVTFCAARSMPVASAWVNSIPWSSNVGASGNVMSAGRRLPNGSQISDGLNTKRSDAEITRMSTSPCSSWLTASAAVSPPKFPPSTSTFLRLTDGHLPHHSQAHHLTISSNRRGISIRRVVGPTVSMPVVQRKQHIGRS